MSDLKIEQIVGHRGFGLAAPENTYLSLDRSAQLGLSYVEYDVRLTRDNVSVVSHDNSLLRCARNKSLISELTYSELASINIAEYYALEDLHENIPTFEEYFDYASDLGLISQIELKPEKGHEERLAKEVSLILGSKLFKNSENQMPLITSFDALVLTMVKEHNSLPIQTGILVEPKEVVSWQDKAEKANADYVHFHALYLKDDICSHIREKGFKINGFHINHPIIALNAIRSGCERFTCDIPEVFMKFLEPMD
jgi:glycerophosphoryl diester phosphodiesterase